MIISSNDGGKNPLTEDTLVWCAALKNNAIYCCFVEHDKRLVFP